MSASGTENVTQAGGKSMDDEQQGCFDPVILGPVVGAGCGVVLVAVLLISLFVLILTVA
jgi:hypothetical protein